MERQEEWRLPTQTSRVNDCVVSDRELFTIQGLTRQQLIIRLRHAYAEISDKEKDLFTATILCRHLKESNEDTKRKLETLSFHAEEAASVSAASDVENIPSTGTLEATGEDSRRNSFSSRRDSITSLKRRGWRRSASSINELQSDTDEARTVGGLVCAAPSDDESSSERSQSRHRQSPHQQPSVLIDRLSDLEKMHVELTQDLEKARAELGRLQNTQGKEIHSIEQLNANLENELTSIGKIIETTKSANQAAINRMAHSAKTLKQQRSQITLHSPDAARDKPEHVPPCNSSKEFIESLHDHVDYLENSISKTQCETAQMSEEIGLINKTIADIMKTVRELQHAVEATHGISDEIERQEQVIDALYRQIGGLDSASAECGSDCEQSDHGQEMIACATEEASTPFRWRSWLVDALGKVWRLDVKGVKRSVIDAAGQHRMAWKRLQGRLGPHFLAESHRGLSGKNGRVPLFVANP